MKLLNEKGQTGIIGAFQVAMAGAFGLLILSQILPALLDNVIGPAIQNRAFGSTTILLYNLILLVFAVGILMAILNALNAPPQAPPGYAYR